MLMPNGRNCSAASRASSICSPGMNLRTARRANQRRGRYSFIQRLRAIQSRIVRMGGEPSTRQLPAAASALLGDTSMGSQIPTTTHPSPDQAKLQAVIRRLAEAESADAPILSVYVDVRPEAHGEAPGRRPELVIVRDRLRDIADSYVAHAPARASVDADAKRLLQQIADTDRDAVDGMAIFACHALGLWEELLVP